MSAASDLDPTVFLGALGTSRLGRRCRFFAECGSTNDVAAAASPAEPEGLLVVADRQTRGRGRLGRAWVSAAGEDLTFSVLLRPLLPAARVPPLTLLAGATLARVLERHGVAATVKWPNDVLLETPNGPRKVAGILTEMATERDGVRHVVLGIGVNVNAAEVPPELASRATSLLLATGRRFDRAALLAAILNALEPAYDGFSRDGPAEAVACWRRRARLGERVRVRHGGAETEGVALDVDADGALLLRDAGGRVLRIVAGEIAA